MTRLLALVGTLLAILGAAEAWHVPDSHADAVPSWELLPGMCHAFATTQELRNWSDVTPPVPCDRPHQAETYTTGYLDFPEEYPVGDQRPRPEALATLTSGLCTDVALAAHMGAGPLDEPWRFSTWAKVPTPDEWSRSARVYRCYATPATESRTLPELSTPLRDVLRSPAGDRFRRCYTHDKAVPCDTPHVAEHIRSMVAIPPGMPPTMLDPAWADQQCRPLAIGAVAVRERAIVSARGSGT